jgi:PAS domain-containing protein
MRAQTRRAALLGACFATIASAARAQTAGLSPLPSAPRDPAGIAARIGILLDRQWDHLQWVARSVQEFWPPQDAEELRFILDTAHDNAPHIIWIGVATVADGRVLAATRRLLEGDDVRQRPWFIEGTQHDAAVDVHDAVLLQRALNRRPEQGMLRLIDFVSPIRDREGRIVAMIGSHILWDWVVGVIRREESHAGTPIALVSAQGEVLLAPEGVPPARLGPAPRVPVPQRAGTPSFGWQVAILSGA